MDRVKGPEPAVWLAHRGIHDLVIDRDVGEGGQGRLTKDELDARVGRTFASRTYGELAALTADLPPGLLTAPSLKPARARARPPMSKVIAGAVLIVPAPAMMGAAFITGSDSMGRAALLALLVYFMAWIVAGAQMAANWHDRRSRGQLPPSAAQRRRALERERVAGTGDDLMLSEAHRDPPAPHVPLDGAGGRSGRPLPVRRGLHGPGGFQIA